MRALTEDESARVVNAALSESADALQALRADATALAAIARAAALIVDAFGRGGRVLAGRRRLRGARPRGPGLADRGRGPT